MNPCNKNISTIFTHEKCVNGPKYIFIDRFLFKINIRFLVKTNINVMRISNAINHERKKEEEN